MRTRPSPSKFTVPQGGVDEPDSSTQNVTSSSSLEQATPASEDPGKSGEKQNFIYFGGSNDSTKDQSFKPFRVPMISDTPRRELHEALTKRSTMTPFRKFSAHQDNTVSSSSPENIAVNGGGGFAGGGW